MLRAKVIEEKITKNNTPLLALFIETKNANVILLSEGEDQLGTLAVALPQAPKMVGPPLSSVLLGDRNTVISRVLAERLAQRTGKMALVSVFVWLYFLIPFFIKPHSYQIISENNRLISGLEILLQINVLTVLIYLLIKLK